MKKGFSLIEILVVITIISILSGLGLASYNDDQARRSLQQETEKLADILALARKKTQANDIQNYDCPNFNGYKVYITEPGYRFALCCDGINGGCDCGDPVTTRKIQDTLFSNGALAIVQPVSIKFNPLTSSATLSPANGIITLKKGSKCQSVTISPSGTIDTGVVITCP
jgi:prepilin-type N-terminal cleavage/methylation domain-containing protein